MQKNKTYTKAQVTQQLKKASRREDKQERKARERESGRRKAQQRARKAQQTTPSVCKADPSWRLAMPSSRLSCFNSCRRRDALILSTAEPSVPTAKHSNPTHLWVFLGLDVRFDARRRSASHAALVHCVLADWGRGREKSKNILIQDFQLRVI